MISAILSELRITRALEAAHPVRLELVRHPDALHRAQRHTGGICHGSPGPIRGPRGRLATRERHDVRHFIGRDRSFAGLARLVTQQPVGTFLGKTLLPAPTIGRLTLISFATCCTGPPRAEARTTRSLDVLARSVAIQAIALSRFLSAALNNTHTVCAMLTQSHGHRVCIDRMPQPRPCGRISPRPGRMRS